MSTGDSNDPIPFTVAEANNIIAFPPVARVLRRIRTAQVNRRDYDIPYLAGYSIDGRTIYIDRDLSSWFYRGRFCDTERFLVLHEEVEKVLIDSLNETHGLELERLLKMLRMKVPTDRVYYHCHGVATALEECAVRLAHGAEGLDSYNRFMATQFKRAEDERIRRVPANLDLTPYTSSETPRDRKLLRVMRGAMAA